MLKNVIIIYNKGGVKFLQKVFFSFDDSGILHIKEKSGYFVYAGYVFTSLEEKETAKRKYISANKALKKILGTEEELKACKLIPKHRRSLFNSIKRYTSVSCAVKISDLRSYVLNDKKSICRYKDYILKRCVKYALQELIKSSKINPNEDIELFINIDEQLTASNGYYSLKDSIKEELQHGISNWDYGTIHHNIFNSEVTVNIKYCDSKNDYLIQASDILANRIWNSYKNNDQKLLENIPNHYHLTFP